MPARAEFRDRDEIQVDVLDALVGRADDGMTVFELRAHVDVDIDRIEEALSGLNDDGLITVEETDETVRIYPDDRVVPDPGESLEEEPNLLDELRALFPGRERPRADGRGPDGEGEGRVRRLLDALRRAFRP
jgi:predicted transcriptional regulator